MGNRTVNYLIDTGSQATLVSRSLIQDLGLQANIRPTLSELSSFTQDKIPTYGEIVLDLTIADTCAQHTCVITNMSEADVLLGTDFMTPNSISVHLGKGTVSSDHGVSEFMHRPKPIHCSTKVRCSRTITLQPNSVTFIKGSLHSKRNLQNTTHSGYLEPYTNLMASTSTLVARAMVYCEKGSIPVRCVNLTDEPVVIYKHKLVGFMKPLPDSGRSEELTSIRVKKVSRTDAVDERSPDDITTKAHEPEEWKREDLYTALKIDKLQIPEQDKQRMKKLVWNYRHCFSRHPHDLGTCNFYEADISLKPDAQPRWIPSRPVAYKLRDELDKHIQGLCDADVIEPCREKSLWNSPIMLIPKPNQPGKYRFVGDFRAVNTQSMPDNYQLPNINHLTDRIGGCKYYSSADLSKSFYQVSYNQKSRPITAFTCNNKRYWFKRMVMGHCTSSAQFTRMMDKLLATMPMDQICYFLDDLLIGSDDITTHIDRIEMLLRKFSSCNLKLTPSKCEFLKKEVTFVGLKISQDGVRITDERVKALEELKAPRNIKETQQVMGFLSYNRKFVRQFGALAKPIYALIDKKSKNFFWSTKCQVSFDEIKRRIAEGITLTIPDVEDPHQSYRLVLDASQDGYGAELSQLQNGERKIIAYFSKGVPNHKKQWGQSKLEFEALVESIDHFQIFLRNTHFTAVTDCACLLSLETMFAKANATQVRRLQKLAMYSFDLEHIDGKRNTTADFLSRYVHKRRDKHVGTQTEVCTKHSFKINCEISPGKDIPGLTSDPTH